LTECKARLVSAPTQAGSGRGGAIPYFIVEPSFEILRIINDLKGGDLKLSTTHGSMPSSTTTRMLI
jgi:hypothetical protein